MVFFAGCSGSDGGDGDSDGGDGDDGSDSGDGSDGSDGTGGDGGDGSDGGSTGGGGGSFTLGFLNPFSGGFGWIGSDTRPAVATALTEINEQSDGVLDGMTIDTNPQATIFGFETLDAAGVPAVVGPSSSVMPNLIEPIQSAKLPLITVTAGTIQLDDVGGTWLWRNVPSDAVGGAASGKYNYEELEHRQMGLSFKNDKWSQSFAASVGEAFETLGGETVVEVPLAVNASSYRSEIGKLQDADADIVQMTAGTEVSTLFVKNYSELGAKEEFNLVLGNDILTEDFVSEVGADVAEGFLGQAPAPGPAFDEFSESFANVNGGEPGAFEAHGAVERQAIPDQLKNISNPPGTKVTSFAEGKEELANGNDIDYVGAANPQNFDDNGNVVGPFSILNTDLARLRGIDTKRLVIYVSLLGGIIAGTTGIMLGLDANLRSGQSSADTSSGSGPK